MRLEVNFTFSLEQLTELVVLGERTTSVAVDKFGVVEKPSKRENIPLRQKVNHNRLLKYRCLGSFPSEYVPILPNEFFTMISMQPSNMQVEQWITIAIVCHKLYSADFLGGQKYSFLKQQCKQLTPELLQSHPRVCRFHTVYAVFHHFKFQQEEITGDQNNNVISLISNY